MDANSPEPFDDPQLKEAIRRVWLRETAPPELIQRLREGRLSAAARTMPRRMPVSGDWLPLAAAAAFLVVMGLAGFRMSRMTGPAVAALTPLPGTLASDLVVRHDECCGQPDHHMPGLPRGNFTTIARVMTLRLGWPVLAGSLPESWSFKGASICPVGKAESAHLVFKRHEQDLSVFSLPAALAQSTHGESSFAETYAGHPIVAFRSRGGLYCIVGSSSDGSIDLRAVDQITTRLRPELDANAVASELTVAAITP